MTSSKLLSELANKSPLIRRLSAMGVSQLSAIYNNCWREHHNDINTYNNKIIMDRIELICGIKAIEISGRGGAWEFQQLNKRTTKSKRQQH